MSLSVFQPADDSASLWTLERALVELVIPRLIQLGRAADTISGYRCAVAYWSKWSALEALKTDGPRIVHPVPLLRVNARALEGFRAWIVGRGLSTRSANKHCAAVLAILAAADLLDGSLGVRVPRLAALPCRRARPRLYFRFLRAPEIAKMVALSGLGSAATVDQQSDLAELGQADELGRLFKACGAATWPWRATDGRRLDPAAQWRAAVVMLATYGLRLGELVATKAKHSALSWAQISWAQETPAAGYHARARHGWFWYVPTKQARYKGDPLVLPLTQPAADQLRGLATRKVAAAGPVFPWPRSKKSLYRAWGEILAAGGFPVKRDLVSGEALALRPEHLRKTAATWLENHRPGLASLVLGHSSRGASLAALGSRVTAEHYTNGELALVEAFEALAFPPAWIGYG